MDGRGPNAALCNGPKPPYAPRSPRSVASQSMYDFFRSALFNMDPERAHRLTTVAARAAHWTRVDAFLEDQYAYEDMRLRTRVWGLSFDNPVGLAAGFDKNAALVDRKSTRLNSSHVKISYAVFCLKKQKS